MKRCVIRNLVLVIIPIRKLKSNSRKFTQTFKRLELVVYYSIILYRSFTKVIKTNEALSMHNLLSQERIQRKPLWLILNSLIRNLDHNTIVSLPQNYRREIQIFSPYTHVIDTSQLKTKNHLISGDIVSSSYTLRNRSVSAHTFKNVSSIDFRFFYSDKLLFLYEQFISEFRDDYYGRHSFIFLMKDSESTSSVGFFPKGKDLSYSSPIFSIFGPYYNNYWHFLIEYLPKLLLLPTGSILIYPRDLIFKKLLEKLAHKYEVVLVPLNPKKAYFFNEITVFSSPIISKASNDNIVDCKLLNDARTAINSLMPDLNIKGYDKLFIARRSIRRVYDDAKLKRRLKLMKFQVRDLSFTSIEFQKNLYRNSRLLCSHPGASWANLLFTNQNSIKLNLVDLNNISESLHHSLAHVFGQELENIAICPLFEVRHALKISTIDINRPTSFHEEDKVSFITSKINELYFDMFKH